MFLTHATVLIAGRIAWTRYKTRRLTSHAPVGRSYWAVVETLIQSAAIMTLALAALLGTYLAESNAHFIIIETLPSLTVRREHTPFTSLNADMGFVSGFRVHAHCHPRACAELGTR